MFLKELIQCCAANSNASVMKEEDRSSLANGIAPPRSVKNRRTKKGQKGKITAGGGRRSCSGNEWRPSLASISEEENVLMMRFGSVKASIVGSFSSCSFETNSKRRILVRSDPGRRHRACRQDAIAFSGTSGVSGITPAFSPPRFMF